MGKARDLTSEIELALFERVEVGEGRVDELRREAHLACCGMRLGEVARVKLQLDSVNSGWMYEVATNKHISPK